MSEQQQQRILVTGAGGMVGSYVAAQFADAELILTDAVPGFEALDVRDPGAVMRLTRDIKPDVVLHLAAATDVDRCQQEPDWAYHSNAIGTQNVALACQRHDAVMVYISTGGVFSGDKAEPYTEFDAAHPANVYGDTKLAGERIVESLLSRYFVIRAGWMIGGGEKDKKFVGKLVQFIHDGKSSLTAVSDKMGSPTYCRDMLTGIRALLDTGYFGTYHLANKGACSRFEIAKELCAILDRPDVQVSPVTSDHYPLPAPRAASEALRNFKLDLLGINTMPVWQDALRNYVEAELIPLLGRP
jgi:dTDP-4-dehydrorhamnose reductase